MERGSRRRLNSEMKMFGSKSSNIKLEMSEWPSGIRWDLGAQAFSFPPAGKGSFYSRACREKVGPWDLAAAHGLHSKISRQSSGHRRERLPVDLG